MTELLNIGIIGAGRIGKVHAATLAYRAPGARLLAVADVNLAAAQELADKHCIPQATADYREVLANPDIQAVFICSPPTRTRSSSRKLPRAGKHIFCEKPIALDLAQIDRTLAAVEAGRRQAAGRLQPPLRRQLRPGAAGDRLRRDRAARPAAHHQPRPRPAAHRLREGVRRHVPGHDHSRLRHGPLPDRRPRSRKCTPRPP